MQYKYVPSSLLNKELTGLYLGRKRVGRRVRLLVWLLGAEKKEGGVWTSDQLQREAEHGVLGKVTKPCGKEEIGVNLKCKSSL